MKTLKGLILRLLWGKRVSAANAIADGIHAHGWLTVTATAALASKYLLVTAGGTTAADATTAAIGVCYEAVTATDIANSIPVRVSALGVGPTKLMVAGSTASGVIAAGAVVAQDAAGTVKAYTSGAGIVVGRALTASSVAGDVLEVATCIAMPYPTAAA